MRSARQRACRDVVAVVCTGLAAACQVCVASACAELVAACYVSVVSAYPELVAARHVTKSVLSLSHLLDIYGGREDGLVRLALYDMAD